MKNLAFIKLNMITAGRARAKLSAVPTGPVQEVNSGTGLSLCLKAQARVHAVNIEKMLNFSRFMFAGVFIGL